MRARPAPRCRRTCEFMVAPPTNRHMRRSVNLAMLLANFMVCVASSRVGDSTTARAPTGSVQCFCSFSSSGMRKAAVLPEPGAATHTTTTTTTTVARRIRRQTPTPTLTPTATNNDQQPTTNSNGGGGSAHCHGRRTGASHRAQVLARQRHRQCTALDRRRDLVPEAHHASVHKWRQAQGLEPAALLALLEQLRSLELRTHRGAGAVRKLDAVGPDTMWTESRDDAGAYTSQPWCRAHVRTRAKHSCGWLGPLICCAHGAATRALASRTFPRLQLPQPPPLGSRRTCRLQHPQRRRPHRSRCHQAPS